MSGDRLENKSEKRCEYNVIHSIAPLLTFSHSSKQIYIAYTNSTRARAPTPTFSLAFSHTHTDARTITR